MRVGELSRNGLSRTVTDALDHDFGPDAVVVPVGILIPATGELWIFIIRTPVTADAIADTIERWWSEVHDRFPDVGWLVINQDNGPENSSRRTQFMSRMVKLADDASIHVELAYYPPYHSKYNAIERCWATLEKYWNGAILDSVAAVVGYASNMTWKGKNPTVHLIRKVYPKGVSLDDAEMSKVEARLDRHTTLGRWFLNIDFAIP